ncbi:hypothetical protein BDV97DRAFT_230495 [Delphinella strobiligena]|nr:hypothetical protein BDV97DRAFT_230495 [Delphinella strobiligena]
MLDRLPAELVLQVFEHLTIFADEFMAPHWKSEIDAGEFNALASICITCKQFHALATPLLYRTYIKPVFLDDEDDFRYTAPSLPRFL